MRGEGVKLCKDCQWFVSRSGGVGPMEECTRNPWPKVTDYVHGGYVRPQGIYEPKRAQSVRLDTNACGHAAIWFQPKENSNG